MELSCVASSISSTLISNAAVWVTNSLISLVRLAVICSDVCLRDFWSIFSNLESLYLHQIVSKALLFLCAGCGAL